MTSAHQLRREAASRAPGPQPGTLSLSALRVPPAARTELEKLLEAMPAMPCTLADTASHHWPTRMLMEAIATDLATLADALPQNPPDSATARALAALAQATAAISTAYTARAGRVAAMKGEVK